MKGKHYRRGHAAGRASRLRPQRLLCLLLCLSLGVALLSGSLTAVTADSELWVRIAHDGQPVSSLTLPQYDRTVLTAEANADSVQYQWQILADVSSELWVSIYDGTQQELSVSYALLASLLDASGSVYVRCRVTRGSQSAVSEPCCITVSYVVPGALASYAAPAALQTESAALPGSITDDAHPEYVQVTIRYLDAVSGLPIYSDFTAQIQYHTAYSNTVISPTYLGYAPYYDASNPSLGMPEQGQPVTPDRADQIVLDIPDTYSEPSYTVNVYYKAINVPYAVRYFFQNIHDDMYTENAALYQTGYAKTGTIISDDMLAAENPMYTDGFTKLYHHPEAVAADGSTVFECYYDRNYYLLKFDMAGGYGVDPIYARYGAPFVVNEPTRHGYVFDGWERLTDTGYSDSAQALPGTVPSENQTYRALWSTVNTTYTVVYWLRETDDVTYDYIGHVTKSAQSGTRVSGSDDLKADTVICGSSHTPHTDSCYPQNFRHFVYDAENTDRDILVNGDGSTVVNVRYDRREYTLRFYYAKEYNPAENRNKDPNDNRTEISYQVVGGSTYHFGNRDTNQHPRPSSYDIESLLYNVPWNQWGKVAELPEPKAAGDASYTRGTYPEDGSYTKYGDRFYYFEFTAPYGADLTELWPSEAFDRVRVAEVHTKNQADQYLTVNGKEGWGNFAYFAGWNGEYNIQYNEENSNSTIKCYYPVLNDTLLYSTKYIEEYGDASTLNFLAFFDNGADIRWSVPRQWIYELYVPLLPGETADDPDTVYRTYNGTVYRLYDTVYANDDNAETDNYGRPGITHQTQPPLPGFLIKSDMREQIVNDPLEDGRLSFTGRFYYTRQSYALTVHNYSSVLVSTSVPYREAMDDLLPGTPDEPSTLEKNAYEFAGWYYSPECYEGSEYTPGTTMPAEAVALYAKWVPKKHTVRFFKSYNAMQSYLETGDTSGLLQTHAVPHGNVLDTVNNPPDTAYIFGGWFFMKNGEKSAYTPLDMPVTREMNVFADWGSFTAQPYRIHFVLLTGEGDAAWQAALQEAAENNPQNNAAYTVAVNGETRTYVYLTEDGRFHRTIADDSAGFAYQGNTRTFYPKAGDPFHQLYDGYNAGLFPTLASHSLVIEEEADKENLQHNLFTFTYVEASEITYRVEYRYQDNGQLIEEMPGTEGGIYNGSTSYAVITERFRVLQNYLPDAFYKRLILAVEKDAVTGAYVGSAGNVLTFYYSRDKQNAFYAIHHMLQKTGVEETALTRDDATGEFLYYTESPAITEGIGAIGSTSQIIPQQFSGFTVLPDALIDKTDPISLQTEDTEHPYFEITVKNEGTELYVFYKRNLQSYKVYYLRYGTPVNKLGELTYDASDPQHANGVLLPVKMVDNAGQFGTSVQEESVPINGMTCVSKTVQSLTLRSDNSQNAIVFFYSPLQFTVEYKVPGVGGTLSRTIEVVNGLEAFRGSAAAALPGYRFAGWYLDADCTVPADTEHTVSDSTLYPTTRLLDPMPTVNIFYAKFTPVYGSLTIVRSNGTADEGNGTRTFVYRITPVSEPNEAIYVTVTGNGSVTVRQMLCRDYTVEQVNGWSWRYGDAAAEVTVTENTEARVLFEAGSVQSHWLNGNGAVNSNRRG